MRHVPPLQAAVRRRRAALAVGPPLALLALPLASPLLAGIDGGVPLWLLDLAVHWQWVATLWLALATGVATLTADRRWSLALLTLPLPWLTAAPQLPARAETAALAFSVASANVHDDNRDATALRGWLAGARPDLVVLLEVTPGYAAGLAALADDYPYREIAAAEGPSGIALLSRRPLTAVRVHRDGPDLGRIDARVTLEGRELAVSAVHLWPPVSVHARLERDRTLAALVRVIDAGGRPGLVIGDLNATPWSTAFVVPDARGWRRASDLTPSWPDGGALALGIPIDHVLASPGWTRVEADTGPPIGSDHRPVLVRLALSPPPGAAGASLALPVR